MNKLAAFLAQLIPAIVEAWVQYKERRDAKAKEIHSAPDDTTGIRKRLLDRVRKLTGKDRGTV